jgi:beta-glucosidase
VLFRSFGLSYSQFEYSDLLLNSDKIASGESIKVKVKVQNTGNVPAAEVVQFYLSDLQASTIVPLHHLIGFKRVKLDAGESKVVELTITPEMMSFFNDDGKLTLEPGEFALEIGGCSPGARGQKLGAPKPVYAKFVVE